MALLGSGALNATVIGTFGDTYPIAEADFLTVIQAGLKKRQQSGDMTRLQQAFAKRAEQHSKRPVPVADLSPALTSSSRRFDPSITVPEDVRDATGHILVHQGARVNPLATVSLRQALLFYDADDAKQTAWATRTAQQHNGKVKFIIVNGAIDVEARRVQQPVFFDQQGRLSTRFGLRHVPTMITQEGLYLRIQEVKL